MAFDRTLCWAFLALLLLASQAGAASGDDGSGGWCTASAIIDKGVDLFHGLAEKIGSLLGGGEASPANASAEENRSLDRLGNYAPLKPSEPSGPMSGKVGSRCSYTTSSADRDDDRIKYTFDWGDGTTSVTSYEYSCMLVFESHSWSKPGIYSVRAKATDEQGASSSWSSARSVTISGGAPNLPPSTPSIPQGPRSGRTGISYVFSTMSKDPEGGKVKYTYDWGDGSTSQTAFVVSGVSAKTGHRWSSPGTFKVKVQGTDERGASSIWSKEASISVIKGGKSAEGE